MEQKIADWQNLWKEKKSTSLDFDELIDRINSVEKKGRLDRIVLIIAVPITITLLVIILPVFSNVYYFSSVTLIGLGMLMILIQTFRSKINLIGSHTELNNKRYLENLISKLKERILIASKYMWVYTFLLIVGINIGYTSILKAFDLSIFARIITHITISVVMLYLMYYGIEKRKKKDKKGLTPLIELLENLNRE